MSGVVASIADLDPVDAMLMGIETVDLRRNKAAVYKLLDEPARWRVRAVERIEYSSSLWVARNRSTHVAPLDNILSKIVQPFHERARIRLPIGAFPRLLLLGFELEIAGQDAYRIPSFENGKLLRGYLQREVVRLITAIQAENGSVGTLQSLLLEPLFQAYLFAASSFEGGEWQRAKISYGEDALVRYLQSNVFHAGSQGWKHRSEVRQTVNSWRTLLSPVSPLFRERDEDVFLQSSSPVENPLLVLPSLKANGIIAGPEQAQELLHHIASFLHELQEWRTGPNVSQGLKQCAANVASTFNFVGDHWIAFADGVVPLAEPFAIQVVEQRGLELTEKRNPFKWLGAAITIRANNLSPTVVLDDAATNHVSLKITDPNVEFGLASDPANRFVELREKRDVILAYTKGKGRPKVAYVPCVIQPSLPLRAIHWVIAGIVVATFLALIIGLYRFRGVLAAPHVALLLTPSTFASALLLSRESSTLSAALAKRLRVLISCLLAVLWLFAIAEYLAKNIVLQLS
ncbi:hypothetical protein [Streptomyces eurythermus]